MKKLFLIIPFIFVFILILSNCQEQTSTEPITNANKTLKGDAHTHIGPCVYCFQDSLGTPVASADVDIYQDSVHIIYLGKTDSTGWKHTGDYTLKEGWYTATAEKLTLFGSEDFYFDPDTLNHIHVEMSEQ